MRPIRSFSTGNDILQPVQTQSTNKMAAPEASVHLLKIVFLSFFRLPNERKLFIEMF